MVPADVVTALQSETDAKLIQAVNLVG